MKTLSLVLLLMASMAFVLLGCSDGSNPLVGTTQQAIPTTNGSSALAKGGAVVHSATGSGQIKILFGEIEYGQIYTFSARQYADGTCSGEVQGMVKLDRSRLHGKVVDLKVEFVGSSRLAKMSIVYTDDVNKGLIGFHVVIDNGEGNDISDMVSIVWMVPVDDSSVPTLKAMSPQAYLDFLNSLGLPFPITVPTDHGNIQVR